MDEQSLFLAALDIADPTQRADFLARACDGNPALREQVEALLTAHESSGEILDVPVLQQMAAATPGSETSAELDAAGAEIDLSFLQPSTTPGSLGRLGHYEVRQVVGRGGCGIVLKAFDEKLERIVAIKVMAPELAATSPARKRFLREARATAAIRHENVANIYAVEEQPLPFLVMEFIDGETLQQRLDRNGPIDVREVLRIGRQIANGLAAAHDMGLIHRDIKPGNILLEKGTDRLKITDFGLARSADDASMTQSGAIVGTPLYMSPEQAQAQNIDHRSDLFSLGSVLYVMCSGRPPFRAATSLAVLRRVVEEQPRPIQGIIPEVPEWLVAIIARLHAKDPAERFASAKETSDLMARYLSELDQRGRVESPGEFPPQPDAAPAPRKRARRSRRWVAVAAAIGVVLSGLSLAEAGGVTNLRGTIIRLFLPDGTLIVDVDDPGVSVTVEGEDIVITGAGVKEIRLRPGPYTVLASKDGKVVRQELITVTTNGRQVVRISKEAAPPDRERPLAALDRRPQFRSGGEWLIEGDEIVQSRPEFARLFFGDANWTDYDLEVEAQSNGKTKDGHGICLLFRATDMGNYMEIDIGGWGATVTEAIFFKGGNWGRSPGCFLKIPHEHGRWYKVKIEARGTRVRCDIDGKNLLAYNEETLLKGMIGLGTGNSSVRWRNLKVTAPDGRILWQGFPELARPKAAPTTQYKNPLGMEFALIPKGTGWLGGGGGKAGEKEVEFDDDFYLGVYEVTQEEWEKVMKANPSHFSRNSGGKDAVKDVADAELKRFPVDNISWNDAQVFLEALNQLDQQAGWHYRLPTAAEWEYACRGGPASAKLDHAFYYYFKEPSNQLTPEQANFRHDAALLRPCPVGSYPPNRLGLHDMHGNIWEWCNDEVPPAPKDPKATVRRMFRGGYYGCDATGLRAGGQFPNTPDYRWIDMGLRVARVRVEAESTAKTPPKTENGWFLWR